MLAGLERSRSWQEELYRDAHRRPELSHREHRTAELVVGRLVDTGYDVRTGVGGTGVVGVLRNGEGPVVLLRADMDGPASSRWGSASPSTAWPSRPPRSRRSTWASPVTASSTGPPARPS